MLRGGKNMYVHNIMALSFVFFFFLDWVHGKFYKGLKYSLMINKNLWVYSRYLI